MSHGIGEKKFSQKNILYGENLSLGILSEGVVSTEVGGLFHYLSIFSPATAGTLPCLVRKTSQAVVRVNLAIARSASFIISIKSHKQADNWTY